MRSAGNDGNLLALNRFRQHVSDRAVDASDEARRRAIIRIGKIGATARGRRDRNRSDDCVAAIVVERIEQQFKSPRLDGAGDLDLVAELAGKVDVEPDRIAIGAGIVEWRIIELGEKANRLDAGKV